MFATRWSSALLAWPHTCTVLRLDTCSLQYLGGLYWQVACNLWCQGPEDKQDKGPVWSLYL